MVHTCWAGVQAVEVVRQSWLPGVQSFQNQSSFMIKYVVYQILEYSELLNKYSYTGLHNVFDQFETFLENSLLLHSAVLIQALIELL